MFQSFSSGLLRKHPFAGCLEHRFGASTRPCIRPCSWPAQRLGAVRYSMTSMVSQPSLSSCYVYLRGLPSCRHAHEPQTRIVQDTAYLHDPCLEASWVSGRLGCSCLDETVRSNCAALAGSVGSHGMGLCRKAAAPDQRTGWVDLDYLMLPQVLPQIVPNFNLVYPHPF